jgi:hypothetical protein
MTEERIGISDVQDEFLIHCYYILKNANDTQTLLDARLFAEIVKLMDKTGIIDSEGPTMSPELLDAQRQAKKLAKKKEDN